MSQPGAPDLVDDETDDETSLKADSAMNVVPARPRGDGDVPSFRVDSKIFSVRQLVDFMADGDLDIYPAFQRKLVWTEGQRSRLIESILLGVPLPSIYLASGADGRLSVVDGQQRLSSIYDFAMDRFPLVELVDLPQLSGMHFKNLKPNLRRRIQQAQLAVNVVDPQAPSHVKFDIFTRLNTGGTPLSAQEIRNALSSEPTRTFLDACANLPAFVEATQGKFRNDRRMLDHEMVLRFVAFRLADGATPRSSMNEFLTEAAMRLDDLSAGELQRLAQDFERAMRNAYQLFGEHAFNLWPLGEERRPRFNNALFDSWSVVLADYDWQQLAPVAATIVNVARDRMTHDRDYIKSLTEGTAAPSKVKTRIDVARKIIAQVMQ
jgi:hypothetical protein